MDVWRATAAGIKNWLCERLWLPPRSSVGRGSRALPQRCKITRLGRAGDRHALASRPTSLPMPAPQYLLNPVRRLPFSGKDSDHECEVAVVPMTWEHVDFWHDHVQPIIQNHYVKWQEGKGGAPTTGIRADVDWNWHYYFWLAKRWNTVRPTARRDQRAVAWCLVVLGEDGKQLPIGMLTAVPMRRRIEATNLSSASFGICRMRQPSTICSAAFRVSLVSRRHYLTPQSSRGLIW